MTEPRKPQRRPATRRPAPEKDVKIYGQDSGRTPGNRSGQPRRRKKNIRINRKRMVMRILQISLLVLLAAGLITALFVGRYVIGLARDIPEWTASDLAGDMTTTFYDRDGNLIAERHGAENRYPVTFDEIPEDLKQAFLAIEDSQFYEHPGISFSGIIRSVLVNLQEGRAAQGASTITQQLARNALLDEDIRYAKRWDRKITEILLALQLESRYEKDEIFEMYLNTISFGQGAYGVQAAARTYFGKDVGELEMVECALLAGLPQRPNGYNPFKNPDAALNRRSVVLSRMEELGYITAAQRNAAKDAPLNLTEMVDTTPVEGDYLFFIDHSIDEAQRILEENDLSPDIFRNGYRIYTTMNPEVQKTIEDLFRDPSNFPDDMNDEKVQTAMVILDHQTGEIQGLMGGREYLSQRGFNRATSPSMRRQPGSSLKPVTVYGPALEYAGMGPATVFDDVPISIPGSTGAYTPTNYDGRYRGLINMREAVRLSVNVPAVVALREIGVSNGYEFARNLGIPLLQEESGNLSIALGGMMYGCNPLELATAYGAFANQGILVDSHAVTRIEDRTGAVIYEAVPQQKEVMTEETAFMMTDMLVTAVNYGTGTNGKVPGWTTAGKTGTTQLPRSTPAERQMFQGLNGNKDAWFAGYTPRYTGVVWMGFDITDREHYLPSVYGGRYPALLFRNAMVAAHKDQAAVNFSRPSGVVSVSIDKKSGLLPSSLTPATYLASELFNRNHVPTEVSTAWEEVEICPESGHLPNEWCPVTEPGVFLTRGEGFTFDGRLPEDVNLMRPREICTIHNADTALPEEPEPVIPDPGQDNNGDDEPDEPADVIYSQLSIGGTESGAKMEWTLLPQFKNSDFEYAIWRRSDKESEARLLQTTTDTNYVDPTVEPDNTYWYTIFATDRKNSQVYRFETLQIIY